MSLTVPISYAAIARLQEAAFCLDKGLMDAWFAQAGVPADNPDPF